MSLARTKMENALRNSKKRILATRQKKRNKGGGVPGQAKRKCAKAQMSKPQGRRGGLPEQRGQGQLEKEVSAGSERTAIKPKETKNHVQL